MAEVVCPPLGITERVLRKVARRKVPALQKAVRMSEADLETLVATGSLTQAGLDAVKKLKEADRMSQLVDNIVLETDEERQQFLDLVASQSPWLQEEMVVEIQAETGSLPIDEAEVEDASFIVHRHFGTSRRFSEQDKKLMTSLVATKAQVTKEVWTRRLEGAKRELEKLQREITEKEKLIRSTNDTLKTFVKRNEMGLYDFSGDTKSTTEILMSSKEKRDDAIINDLIKRTNFILKKFTGILLDRQNLTEQREECMAILKVEDQRTPLHMLIKDTIKHLSKENNSTREQLKSMKVKVVNLEEQLNERDLLVDQLQAEVNELRSSVPVSKQPSKTSEAKSKSASSNRPLSRLATRSVTSNKVNSTIEDEDCVDAPRGLSTPSETLSMSPIQSRPTTTTPGLSHHTRTSTPYSTRRPSSTHGVPHPPPQKVTTSTAKTTLVPLQKTTRSRTVAMWPNARDGKAKGCLLDV